MTTSSMWTAIQKIIFSLLSIAAGVWAFVMTQEATKPLFEPLILPACTNATFTSMDDFVSQTGLHAFEPAVGLGIMSGFVCAITQFLDYLTQPAQYPAGLLTWGVTMLTAIPATVVMVLESGRRGNRGLILWPTLLGLLCQFLGVSVVFPAIVVPSYCWGVGAGFSKKSNNSQDDNKNAESSDSEDQQQASVALTRSRIALFMALPGMILSILVLMVFDNTGYAWTVCAGILGGPLMVFPNLLLWLVPPPKEPLPKVIAIKSGEAAAMAYGIGGMFALLGWFYLAFIAYTTYGTDYSALWNDLWVNAHPSVQFMTIDASVLWVGLVLHIGSRRLSSMAEAILFTPFFGPAAGCSMALASLEIDSIPMMTVTARPAIASSTKTDASKNETNEPKKDK